jgi:alpha-beta hydrolase superfamily lysophospholipase
MTASPPIEPNFVPTLGLAEAIYFASGEHKLFGWIHRPSPGSVTRTGLVICAPFGYEAICSHRSLRSFADAAAVLGVPTLRFDYLGTGDSAEIRPNADQLDLWSRDVIAAVTELKRRTGIEHVCLLGFRLGAVLATLVANQCEAVDSLILVAPVISGRRYLRELRTTRLASSLGADPAEKAKTSAGDGSMEVCGFTLSAATIEALAQTELTTIPAPRVSEMLVIDRSDLPAARAWSEAISGSGIRTQYLTTPGFVEMMLTPPQFAAVPHAMIEAMREWLLRFERDPSGQPDGTSGARLDRPPDNTSTILPLASAAPGLHSQLTERPVTFGCGAILFGIVTESPQDQQRRGAVIMLNSGADYHIGASRMYVSLARRWAQNGYVVLRMDLAGLGDSGTRSEQLDDDVFPPKALQDIRDAIDYIHSRYGACDITVGGLCSGAYHALRAAVAGLSLNRILMINPQNFFWKEGATLQDLQLAEVVRNPAVYRERVLSATAWRRLLTGQVNLWRLVAIYIQRFFLALESSFRDFARQIGIRLPRDLGWELEEIGARGIDAIFVFSPGDPGIDLLKLQAGSSLNRLGDRLRIHIIDGADHNFSHSGPRALMERILCDELCNEKQWTGGAPARSPSSPIAQAHVHKLGTQ